MAGAATLLWPFVGFLTIVALATWWQARAAKRELEQSPGAHDDPAAFAERQDEIGRFKRSRELRAAIFAALALAALLYLRFLA
jgi:hypothetical protein